SRSAWGDTNNSIRWIYPGQTLPADIPYIPLTVGNRPGAAVQVQARDWFLLRRSGFFLPSTNVQRPLDEYGPVLTDSNAQVYYRLVSGMILKDTMRQMGMKAS